MKNPYNFDANVLIIGGGPAGLAIGIVCARNGLDTVVCEKNAYPVDKACGEGIMPTGVAHLRRLGIAEHLRSQGYFPFHGIRYISSSGQVAEASFREGPGWGVRRMVLSEAMVTSTQKYELMHLFPGTRVDRVNGEGSRIVAQAGELCFRSDLVIGADGLNSLARNWIGAKLSKRKRYRWGVRRHYAVKPWCDFVEVYWGNGIEAYVTPVGPELVNLAFLWDRSITGPLQGKDKIFQQSLGPFDHRLISG